MHDTPDIIYKKQFDIFYSKSLKERFLMNLELSEFVRETTKRRIKRENPGISDLELKKEMFRQFYSDVFTEEYMLLVFENWK